MLTLVVREGRRGNGIGEQLMRYAEQWAAQRGAACVRLRSNVIRADAHRFYQRLGYRVVKTQLSFEKLLEG